MGLRVRSQIARCSRAVIADFTRQISIDVTIILESAGLCRWWIGAIRCDSGFVVRG